MLRYQKLCNRSINCTEQVRVLCLQQTFGVHLHAVLKRSGAEEGMLKCGHFNTCNAFLQTMITVSLQVQGSALISSAIESFLDGVYQIFMRSYK